MCNFLLLGFTFAAIAATTFAGTPVLNCNNGISLPSNTQVNDCTELPCPLKQGSTVVMNATFTSDRYTSGLRPQVIAYALGEEVNYPLSEPDGCNSLIDARCPIEEGETVTYQLRMPILILYPKIPLDLQFTLFDENNSGIICFYLEAQVV